MFVLNNCKTPIWRFALLKKIRFMTVSRFKTPLSRCLREMLLGPPLRVTSLGANIEARPRGGWPASPRGARRSLAGTVPRRFVLRAAVGTGRRWWAGRPQSAGVPGLVGPCAEAGAPGPAGRARRG